MMSSGRRCYTAPMSQPTARGRARRLPRTRRLPATQGRPARACGRRRHAGRTLRDATAVQARLSTPWLEFDAAWLARQLTDGQPILRFDEIPFDWGEFRTLFRQVSEVLRRFDLLEPADLVCVQDLIRAGRPTRNDVASWYEETASRRANRPAAAQSQTEAVGQVLA